MIESRGREAGMWIAIAVMAMQPRLASADVQPTKEFAEQLRSNGLTFDGSVFVDFDVGRVLRNSHFNYSFALRHRKLPLEIRFATYHEANAPAGVPTKPPAKREPDRTGGGRRPRPIQLEWDRYKQELVGGSILNMAAKDVAGPKAASPQEFDARAVQEEFNAEWGFTSAFEPDPAFAKYDRGLVAAIGQGRTIGYIIYLYNGELTGELEQTVGHVFHGMRFRTTAQPSPSRRHP